MQKKYIALSVPENHTLRMHNRKKPVKSPWAGNLLIVGVFLGVFVYVGLGEPNPPIEEVKPKINPWNIVKSIPGIYNI